MSTDTRKYFNVKNCKRTKADDVALAGHRKGVLENIAGLGKLDMLNDVGGGAIGEGLRALSSVSNAARTGVDVSGNSAVPSLLGKITGTALESVDQGAVVVLDAMGLGGAYDAVSEYNPVAANKSYSQAKSVFQRVKQGHFTVSDIPTVFAEFQNLETLQRGIFGTAKTPPRKEISMCGASPYAVDLIAHAPKFNFMFVVDITFDNEYADWKNIGETTAFVVKRSGRPGVEFEYEDINMYNFWTKVPKRTVYPPLTMSFYDDNRNAAHLFYTAYMRAMSPISNVNHDNMMSTTNYEKNSMDFDKAPSSNTFGSSAPSTREYAASLGSLNGNSTSIIRRIRLYHIFDYGKLMNVYNFYNPRILSFTPTELNMAETGDGAEFDMQFAYDGLFIEPGFSIQEGGNNKKLQELTNNGGSAQYPIRPTFADDDRPSENSQQSLAPYAQQQNGAARDSYIPTAAPPSPTSASSTGGGSNYTSGIRGAINDGISSAKSTYATTSNAVSNAFKTTSNYVGSWFG